MEHWNDLPNDILAVIGDLLDVPIDYARFGAVCTSCRSSSLFKWPKHLFNYYKIPCLVLPCDDNNDQKLQGFYHLSNHEIHHLELPELRHRHCVGSSNGWLVTLEEGLILKLLNPITKSEIQLPPISSFPDIKEYDPTRLGQEYTIISPHPVLVDDPHRDLVEDDNYLSQADVCNVYIDKIVLSYTKSNDFIAVAIYGDYLKLAFTKFGDDKRIDIPTSLIYFIDCIFSDGKIYAINIDGDFVIATIDTPTQLLVTQLMNLDLRTGQMFGTKLYLVKTDGDELLMVEKLVDTLARDIDFYKTVGFNLYKFDFSQSKWFPIDNLDDYAIFLGLNTSLCISSTYCPKFEGNHIYYTDDIQGRNTKDYIVGHDFGVFNVRDRSLQTILYHECPSRLFFWPQPMWVVLNPC